MFLTKSVLLSVGLYVLLSALADVAISVDRNNFKTCEQSAFCKRQRAHQPETPYTFQADSIKIEKGHVYGVLENKHTQVKLKLDLYSLKDNRFRFKLDELNPIKKRYEVKDVIVDDLALEEFEVLNEPKHIEISTSSKSKAIIYYYPFKVEFYIDKYLVSSLNSRQLLKFEHLRLKNIAPEAVEATANNETNADANAENLHKEDEEAGSWEETFKTHTDSKPNGPESVGMDITFNDFKHVYGIPQHADSFALKNTDDTDPYRLYNLDVFEYELNNPMALYGSIPFMVAHNEKFTVGVLWLNAAETWVDVKSNLAKKSIFSQVAQFITKSEEIPEVSTRWMSESGVIDIYVLLGPKPDDLFRQYGKLTGNTQLPPLFSIAYHQCRWNYNDEEDVKAVNAGFEEHQLPMDVMWLDIEHTDNKRYFTWDEHKFPNPTEMMEHLSSYGRKLVTIVDPHIKVDSNYHIYNEAKDKNFFVKDKTGNNIDGWCWPGSSSWPDFLDEEVQNWWATKFLLENYKGTTLDTFTWNDMNEPSMFNGPEVTFHKDAIHLSGVEHRNVHNQYGQYLVKSTHKGHLLRTNYERRPFILTRSTFAGSQRYGAVWTGDNAAEWGHLKASIQMCLSFSVAGMSFCGADIGGFFKNPDAELMVRWYQAAAYQPFFRSHAHIDTKRREPWLFGEDSLALIRDAIHARYSLIYYWYTLFYLNEKSGKPPMLPLWAEFPTESNVFAIDDQHLVGPSIMIKPIASPGATSIDVVFPGADELWYDLKTMRVHQGASVVTFTDVTLSTIPAFQRGGSIVPYKFRLRRSTTQMVDDPFTLVVALDKKTSAVGQLYFDDSITFNYRNKSEFVHREFTFSANKLSSKKLVPESKFETKVWLERVIVYGYPNQPSKIKIEHEGQSAQLQFTYDSDNKVLLIRKPAANINHDWSIFIN